MTESSFERGAGWLAANPWNSWRAMAEELAGEGFAESSAMTWHAAERSPADYAAHVASNLEAAESKSLELAELCERKAELLRDMAEALAARRLGSKDSAWQREARDIAEQLERKAARGQPASYKAQSGQPIACAYVKGRAAWTLDGRPIARRTALAMIAERMAARLG